MVPLYAELWEEACILEENYGAMRALTEMFTFLLAFSPIP